MKCLQCKKKTSNPKFCNVSCAAKFNNRVRKVEIKCLYCGKEVYKPKKYCNHSCQHSFYFNKRVTSWLNGEISPLATNGNLKPWARRYIKEKFGNKCSKCGWKEINPSTGNVPVEVDHIDGDYKNNSLDNLRLLCPNCHSLTSNYRALNIGNGRENRRK